MLHVSKQVNFLKGRDRLFSERCRWSVLLSVSLRLAELLTLCSNNGFGQFWSFFVWLKDSLLQFSPIYDLVVGCGCAWKRLPRFAHIHIQRSCPQTLEVLVSSKRPLSWATEGEDKQRSVVVNEQTDFSTALEMAWIGLDPLLQWGVFPFVTVLLAFQFAWRQVQTVGACFA